jgi:predicted transcriptional regulator
LSNKSATKNREKETILLKTLQLKTNHTLPKEVSDTLRGLSLAERKAYATELVNAGWTLQSIATELGITREAVRLYTLKEQEADVLTKIKSLPIPPIPTKEIYSTRIKKVMLEPSVVAQLKELHAKAKLVRGKGNQYRDEAELFTKIAWQQVERGVSTYALAKAIGITNGALTFRFVRYGYKATNGQSKVFRQLTHRSKNA